VRGFTGASATRRFVTAADTWVFRGAGVGVGLTVDATDAAGHGMH
jgi:hypothetical protein